jgi:hypothetical protein
MSFRIPRAGRWHEGLDTEELHQKMANSYVHQLSNKNRPTVIAFVLCFAAILALGIAAVTMVRVAPAPETGRTSDADMSIERMVSAPPT